MTTIATDGRSMAGDGISTHHDMIADRQLEKVWRLNDGRIVGCAGDRADALAFRDWLNGGERPKIKRRFEGLALSPDGALTFYNETCLEGMPAEAPAAVGSGMDFAVGALDNGATAQRAVEIAAGRDIRSGGKITVISLEDRTSWHRSQSRLRPLWSLRSRARRR